MSISATSSSVRATFTNPLGSFFSTVVASGGFAAQIRIIVVLLLNFACLAVTAIGETQPSSQTPKKLTTSELWSIKPLSKPSFPIPKNRSLAKNPIDLFVLAKLESKNLTPAQPADPGDLLRRLSFDLLGLPPTPELAMSIQTDTRPDSYERIVDRLIASPAFGERWGRHWLDVTRYTESQGYEYDRLRDNAWHYRDYVIQRFNENIPYDRFMAEQIAGDVLDPVTRESTLATGLLVGGPYDEAGNSQANKTQRMITREEELEDLVGTVGQTFLGLTVNCARCHSHKFDPIPQSDYYRMKSVFEGIRHGEQSVSSPSEFVEIQRLIPSLQTSLTGLQQEIQKLEQAALKRSRTKFERDARKGTEVQDHPRFDFSPIWDLSHALKHYSLRKGLEYSGQATNQLGIIHLPTKQSFVQTAPLSTNLTAKTLVAWVSPSTLDQRGGSVLSVETMDGSVFDGLVFGEREPRKWMAGSNGFVRSKNLDAPLESVLSPNYVHIATVYEVDGSIQMFRNGVEYGKRWKPADKPVTFASGSYRLLLGLRHSPPSDSKWFTGSIASASVYDRALSAAQIKQLFQAPPTAANELHAALNNLGPLKYKHYKTLVERAQVLEQRLAAASASTRAYVGSRVQPAPTRRLDRGDVLSPGETVAPGGLDVVQASAPFPELAPDAPEADRRKTFAKWLTNPHNPLPARTMVNRLWHYHFGQGIVATPNDLGKAGSPPSHPELLDWLAHELISSQWDLKHIHRLIVTSATYRQSSKFDANNAASDADNVYLWRHSPKRLEAEAVRDAILMISNELSWSMGGPSMRMFDFIQFPAQTYVPFERAGPNYSRRTVYRMNVNSGKDPMLDAFDCPDPSVKAPRRGFTSTPLQALSLMNGSLLNRSAERIATTLFRDSKGQLSSAVPKAYQLILQRSPSEVELHAALQLGREHGLSSLCWSLLNSTEFIYVR